MLHAYSCENNLLKRIQLDPGKHISQNAVWIDLFEPTPQEEHAAEQCLNIDIPTRAEMNEIELSNRFYQEGDALYLTLTVIANADHDPQTHAVTFVLTPQTMVSVRYTNLQPFHAFSTRAERSATGPNCNSKLLFMGLLEAIINRLADILETAGSQIDKLSHQILHQRPEKSETPDFQKMLEQVGQHGDRISKARESMVSIQRLIGFLSTVKNDEEVTNRLRTIAADASALNDHAMFLSGKITFLLDATLGMINIEQNNIIKIFSVAAVVFLPPTLIASIYGMNFRHMPELNWMGGYPMALCLMVASAILPYSYFKRRKWL